MQPNCSGAANCRTASRKRYAGWKNGRRQEHLGRRREPRLVARPYANRRAGPVAGERAAGTAREHRVAVRPLAVCDSRAQAAITRRTVPEEPDSGGLCGRRWRDHGRGARLYVADMARVPGALRRWLYRLRAQLSALSLFERHQAFMIKAVEGRGVVVDEATCIRTSSDVGFRRPRLPRSRMRSHRRMSTRRCAKLPRTSNSSAR